MTFSWQPEEKLLPNPKAEALETLLVKTAEFCGLKLEEDQTISISFVGRETIEQVNNDFVGHEGITDVIGFDYREDDFSDEESVVIELIICIDKAVIEGNSREDSSYANELVLYIVHGLLHMAGEDDLETEARKKMRQREAETMEKLAALFEFSEIFPEE
jgi:probable rRNA maturation factor